MRFGATRQFMNRDIVVLRDPMPNMLVIDTDASSRGSTAPQRRHAHLGLRINAIEWTPAR